MKYDLVLRNACVANESLLDIGIKDGLFSRIDAVGKIDDSCAVQEIDVAGGLMLPSFVETHIHLDTVLTAGDPKWNDSGTLFEGIKIWQERKKKLTREDVISRAIEVIRQQVVKGILFVRSHADISDPKLTALRALLEVREMVKPYVQLQIIAFPQDGIFSCPDNQQRLEEALILGADGIGAIPHCEYSRESGVASLAFCFSLAQKYGSKVHVFCDEVDDESSRYLEVTAELAIQTGLTGKVTVSHANATAYYNEAYFQKLVGLVAKSGIHIVACPLVNSVMQGRFDSFPKGRGIARIKELWQAGVNISIAHDDIQTPFYPLGNVSMLQAAHMAVHLAHMTGVQEMEEVIRMVTNRPAATLGIEEEYGIEIGKPANFNIFSVSNVIELLRLQPECRYVVSKGVIVSETIPASTLLNLGSLSHLNVYS